MYSLVDLFSAITPKLILLLFFSLAKIIVFAFFSEVSKLVIISILFSWDNNTVVKKHDNSNVINFS